jgi:hypothetical protein
MISQSDIQDFDLQSWRTECPLTRKMSTVSEIDFEKKNKAYLGIYKCIFMHFHVFRRYCDFKHWNKNMNVVLSQHSDVTEDFGLNEGDSSGDRYGKHLEDRTEGS